MAGWVLVDADALRLVGSPDFPEAALDTTVVQMLRGFRDVVRMALVTTKSREVIEHWCTVRGLLGFWDSVYETTDVHKAADAIDRADHVEMVVVANPRDTRALLAAGHRVATIASPHYARDEFRPDYEQHLRTWEDIEVALDAEARERAGDKRLTPDDLDDGRYEA